MSWNRLARELALREAAGEPVRVAVAGTGFIGRGLINQIGLMRGISIVAAANRNPDKAMKVLAQAGFPLKHRLCRTEKELGETVRARETGVVDNPLLLADLDADVICDCTGDVETGAALGLAALGQGRHFITNAEVDATVGPVLSRLAREKGLVYSGVYGDEPGVIMRLYSYVSMLGLEIVAAGKFKKYYNRLANPLSVKQWADKYGHNPYLIASFADGTKLGFEMTQVANASGLLPEVRGMHCPRATLDTMAGVLSLKEQGGILDSKGVVEVVQDVEPSGGVFVVAAAGHPQIREDLQYLKMGDGPNYLFYCPYHLCAIEVPVAVLQAVLDREASIAPLGAPAAEVLAVAKRDLRAGEVLDAIGGYTFYGLIDRADAVRSQGLLPAGMARGARTRRGIRADQPIAIDDVEVDDTSVLWKLRKLQDSFWP